MQAATFTAGEHSPAQRRYHALVRDINDIRLWNFMLLLQLATEKHGKTRGAMAYLAKRCNVKPSQISDHVSGKVQSSSGKKRRIGDDVARRLEQGMGKPHGWMDVDRSEAATHYDAELLDAARGLALEQQKLLLEIARSMGVTSPKTPPILPRPSEPPLRLSPPKH